jgi:hypothetical protein
VTMNITGDTTSINDWVDTFTGLINIGAAYRKMPVATWERFLAYRFELYQGDTGALGFDICAGVDLFYTPAEDDYFYFEIGAPTNVFGGTLECRYGSYPEEHRFPSVACNRNYTAPTLTAQGFHGVLMRLHPALDMSGIKTYRIILDGRDGNGFGWSRFGFYSILA